MHVLEENWSELFSTLCKKKKKKRAVYLGLKKQRQ